MKTVLKRRISLILCLSLCVGIFMGTSSDILADDTSQSIGFQYGDVDGNQQINLNDAQITLKAALRIITLENKALQAADLGGDGLVSLEDARNILSVALKIKDMDEILEASGQNPADKPTELPSEMPTEVPTEQPIEEPTEVPTKQPIESPIVEPTQIPSEEPEYIDYKSYIEENVKICVDTEGNYQEGEIIHFTIQVQNLGQEDIPLYGRTSSFEQASCLRVKLLKDGIEVADSWDGIVVNEEIYQGVLNSQETITYTGALAIPATDVVTHDAVYPSAVYAISVAMEYWEDNSDDAKISTHVEKFFEKIRPVTYHDVYVNEYLEIQVTAHEESYNQGEMVTATVTVTNTGAELIYMHGSGVGDELSNVRMHIVDTRDFSIIDCNYLWGENAGIFTDVLKPGESRTVERECLLEDDLESKYDGKLLEQEFIMEVTFEYSNSVYKGWNDKYIATFPIIIINQEK